MLERNRWLLPEGIEELLPDQAELAEKLRRQLLDLFHSWGYEQVVPPLIEYLDSLLVGAGDDLDLHTFKLTDQLDGRLLGVRADMTPQVARIDAHTLNRRGPSRLCYIGNVLHTQPTGFSRSRSPVQLGAELYGHEGIESDVEVLLLMIETLQVAGLEDLYVDLGHVGIFRKLAQAAGFTAEVEAGLFDAMQRKAKPDIEALFDEHGLSERWLDVFLQLVDFNGDRSTLETARRKLVGLVPEVESAIGELEQITERVMRRLPGTVTLHFDLAELRGYHYKTGVVFAAFIPGHGQEIARGGRYDEIGKVFGRARAATGFSTDLDTLLRLIEPPTYEVRAILAPDDDDPGLQETVRQLRGQGERVVYALGRRDDGREQGCDRRLSRRNGVWLVEPIS